jgi:hypothetical protein
MIFRAFPVALLVGLVVLGRNASGQISITSGNLSYSQSFDTLTRNTTAENWTDNVATTSVNDPPQVIGLEGWYAGNFGTTATTPLQIRAGTGTGTLGMLYSFGSSGAADRALGTLPTDSTASGSMRTGARFVNNTGGTISGFSFSYDGEEWRVGSATGVNNQFVVAYSPFGAGSGALDPSPSGYISISSATFNTPQDGTGTGAALDGNAAANRVAGLTGVVTELSVANGDEIWLRWFDSNSSGADHGIAIDNFAITFEVTSIPEPSFVALISLGFLFLIRRAPHRG